MTVARKTIRGRLTTLTEAQIQAGARVSLSAVEVLEDGTTRGLDRVADLTGHLLMIGDDTHYVARDSDGSYSFSNVPVTDSTETSPTGFALELKVVSSGELVESVVFLLPESDPDEQWIDEIVAMGDAPLTPTYPQLVNQAVEALAAIPATITATLADDASDATAVVVGRINAAINALVNGAPGALNTLKEIADQLAADEGAASSVAAALATHAGRTDNPHATTKAQVGLGSVDNTSDLAKPVSTAQAAAIATAISNLVAGAPGALDTLKELADQLGSDENAAGALTTLVAGIRGLSDSTFLTALNNAFAGSLTATAVKTSAYGAAAGDLIPVDATSGPVTITLPTAPAARTRVTVKKIDTTTNAVTVSRGGSSDVFNKAGGSTSVSLTLTNQAVNLQYSGGVWYVVSDDLPLSGLDTRFATKATEANLTTAVVDRFTVEQLDRLGVAQVRATNGQRAIDYDDAAELLEDWTNLTANSWFNTGVQVSSNRLYSVNGANPAGARKAYAVSSSETMIMRAIIHLATPGTGTTMIGVDFGGAAAPVANYLGTVAVGFMAGSVGPAKWIGTARGSTGATAMNPAGVGAATAGDYLATVIVDPVNISLSLVSLSDPGWEGYTKVLLNSGSPTAPTNLAIINSDANGLTGNYIKALSVKKALAPRLRTGTTSGGESARPTVQTVYYTNPVGAVSLERNRIAIPAGYDQRKGAPLVIVCHQRNGTVDDPVAASFNTGLISTCKDLMAAGFIVASANAPGSLAISGTTPYATWSNDSSLAQYQDLWNQVRKIGAITSTQLFCCSMGGNTAANLLARRTIPGITSMACVDGAFNLASAYADINFTQNIEDAYAFAGAGNYAAATAGHDPLLRRGWEFRGVPMWLATSNADTTIPRATNTDAFKALVETYSPVTLFDPGSGGHNSTLKYPSPTLVNWFAAHA